MDDLMKELQSKNKEFSQEYSSMMQNYYKKLMSNPQELQKQLSILKQAYPDKFPNQPNQIDAEGGITITPQIFCCMKTVDQNGQKIFINLVSHEEVSAPAEEHILELENREGVRIPLSLSDKFEDFDANGNICQVYDCILNPDVLKKTENNPLLLKFIMELIAARIQERFQQKIIIETMKKMKNMKYKGKTVRQQRIRAKRVKIQEVLSQNSVNNSNSKIASEINKEVNERGRTPNWNFIIIKAKNPSGSILKDIHKNRKFLLENKGKINAEILNKNIDNNYEYYNGYNANPKFGYGLLFVIELELLTKSAGIKLNLEDNSFTLYCGKIYSLELNLVYKVNSNDAISFFVADDRILYLYMPFYISDVNELRTIKDDNKKDDVQVNISEDYLYDVVQ